MPYRRFEDTNGVEWEVYDVVLRDNPRVNRPRLAPQSGLLPPYKAWLAFESMSEKRRLHEIPKGWSDVSDEELRRLLARATPVIEDS
jgi:hypothetical protein